MGFVWLTWSATSKRKRSRYAYHYNLYAIFKNFFVKMRGNCRVEDPSQTLSLDHKVAVVFTTVIESNQNIVGVVCQRLAGWTDSGPIVLIIIR